jgi:aminoglycoside/choline kinase family phosphotransferase
MNFGFTSGDDGVGQPYFYVTAYPFDEKLFEIELPVFARWQKEGWKGVVVEYDQLLNYSVTENDLISLMKNLLEQNFTKK